MVSRVAGRLVTGPFAFLAAGIYDFMAFFLVWGWASLRRRVTRAG